jgi:hypothetical protein
MILILSNLDDKHADDLAAKLRSRGAEFIRFDPARFPAHAELSLVFSTTGALQRRLRVGEETIDLDSVRAVWYRRPGEPVPDARLEEGPSRRFVAEESKRFVHDVWHTLDCFWLPAQRPVIHRAGSKAWQLQIAGELGFVLPPTLFTNSPSDFLEFYLQHNGNIISKLAETSLADVLGEMGWRYTEVVSKRDVAHARAIRYCPIIFQEYVPKCSELRITVVGREIFAAEIHSQESNHTRHDWRHYDHHTTRYSIHDLPQDVERRCIQLVERLGLCFGAIDMVVTPDGHYVFLEVNPNGQYLWIEMATGLPISDAICDLLIDGSSIVARSPYSSTIP